MIASPDEIKPRHRLELQFSGTESLAGWLGLPEGVKVSLHTNANVCPM
jgi:hypothetical protein